MAFTLEDVNALTDEQITPELEAALMPKIVARATTYLTNNGHVVKKKDEYDADVETQSTTKTQAAIDNEAAKFYSAVDNAISLATGKTKPDKMKTREWVIQLDEEGLLPFTDAQVKKIKDALKGAGSSDPKTEGLIEGLQKQIKELTDSDGTKAAKLLEKTVNRAINSDLRNAPVAIDSSVKDAEKIKAAKTAAISDLTDLFKGKYEGKEDEEGEIYFVKKGETAALMNTVENRYMTPLEIVQQNHKIFLAVQGHQQQGGGTKNPKEGNTTPSNMTDIVRLAGEAGHRFGSKAYNDFIAEKKKEFNIK